MILDISTFDDKITVIVQGDHDKKGLAAILNKEGVLRKGALVAKVSHAWAECCYGDTFGLKTWRLALEGDEGAHFITIGTLRRA